MVHVSTPDGNVREALTYTVVEGRRENRYIAPTDDYQRLISSGLKLRGLPTDELENAIHDGGLHFPIPYVFTYGTLMQGESRQQIIQELLIALIIPPLLIFMIKQLLHLPDLN